MDVVPGTVTVTLSGTHFSIIRANTNTVSVFEVCLSMKNVHVQVGDIYNGGGIYSSYY